MSVAQPESPVLKTPEWLEVLENKRKRPHKLAHEVGAGAPCLVCKDKCKGLNLHFWRKLCIECKCRKEDHEVQEEEDYAQFEILFGAKKVKRAKLKFDSQNKTFDWIPPDVTPELAVDYLKSIPQSKLPISDSEGARYRKQQLEKQLPLHDVDPNACHNLSDKEMQEFQKYLDNLKSNVIGQGKILKYQSPKLLKENYINENLIASSEKYSSIKPHGIEIRSHLSKDKIPGFNSYSQSIRSESYPIESLQSVTAFQYSQSTCSDIDAQPLKTRPLEKNDKIKSNDPNPVMKANNANFNVPNSISTLFGSEPHPIEGIRNTNAFQYSESVNSDTDAQPSRSRLLGQVGNSNFSNLNPAKKPNNVNFSIPKPFLPSLKEKDTSSITPESQINNTNNLELRTPSSFISRKSSVRDNQNNNSIDVFNEDNNCNEKCYKSSIRNTTDQSVDENQPQVLNSKGNFIQESNGNMVLGAPYEASICKNPLDKFKELNVSCSDVPFIPVQESKNISVPNIPTLKDSNNQSNVRQPGNAKASVRQETGEMSDSFPAPPETCQQCLEILYPNEIVIQTDRGGNLAFWHAKCFVCETCKELLVDLMYFYYKGKVYCGRHYAEITKMLRCYACDELIFVKEYTCAEGKSFHVRHFCCFHCDEPLGGKQYIPKDNQPICLNCYQIKFGKTCQTCSLPIAAGEQRVSWEDLDFHVSPQCFRCAKCLKSLLGGRFVVKYQNTFCSKECVQGFVN